MGVFVQDRWTVSRLTVNAGLRFDYNHTGLDEYTFGPGPWSRTGTSRSPRRDFYVQGLLAALGAAYDLLRHGDGRQSEPRQLRTGARSDLGRPGA